MVIDLEISRVLRINKAAGETQIDEIELPRRDNDAIHRIFIDPTGHHVIITLASADNWYLHSSVRKARNLSKMKGVLIESVAWDKRNTSETSTREILIGSRTGVIFEAVIDGREKYFKTVYDLNESMPISGLHFEVFPQTQSTEQTKFFVMATTPTRYYEFVGGPTFEAVFSNYTVNPGFNELPGELDYSELHFFSKYKGRAKSFAWLTGPGVYHGALLFGSQNAGDKVVTDPALLAYPTRNQYTAAPPVSLAVTEFHFLLAYRDRFVAISKLNEDIVYENSFPQGKPSDALIGLATDLVTGKVYVYSASSLYEVAIHAEDRHVWKLYLEKGAFETALGYCNDAGQRDKVLTAQADHYFQHGQYELAATFYAKTQKLFEEVTLRFVSQNERDALKTYLLHKMDSLRRQDATQLTLICTWLTEIYLDKLNQLKDSGKTEQYDMMLEEMRQFLTENKDNLDAPTTFHLISSHGRIDDLLYYATLIEDFEMVISHFIQCEQFERALEVMTKQNKPEIYYKFSPVLMHHAPYHTVNAWISAPFLEPRKLLPALMRYSEAKNPADETQNQAIRYLQHCVKKLQNKDPAIHNYLISLYAKQPDDSALLQFLHSQGTQPCFDLKYALRLCKKEGKTTACVHVYSLLGLYEEAVDLALKVDNDLAKINADKPEDDEQRKKLWLKIARHVVEEEKDIKQAIQFLSTCDLLKIEDILPFFPDFVLIQDFKDAICNALEDYNRHIEELKQEMDEATRSADLIRYDIKDLRNRYGFVKVNQTCDLCHFPVLSRQFYLFPCQHAFHADCLLREVMKHLNPVHLAKVKDLQARIAQEARRVAAKAQQEHGSGGHSHKANNLEDDSATLEVSTVDQLRQELDDTYVANECPFCGDLMIKSIEEPFIGANEADEVRSWEI
eukprot:TRINITY_DN40509_c0_g1_i1.p1 TRINITY_DN40509_c0_g1~~TRINITY_DN40509_c0_g1_i1.p1  ORF type:complete len:911 (+),score=256.88 TRINITY_DN40509_c0_g1_i1:23-2734(+)